jgi:hypothetical protein
MIVMNLEIDNFFAFKNFQINLSYPKKIVNSFIGEEYLPQRQNFRFKKVIVLMGGNASGKTSLGQMIMAIFNFIDRKNISLLHGAICDLSKGARFSIDFVAKSNRLYRVETIISSSEKDAQEKPEIFVCVKSVPIGLQDNYERCAKRLHEIPTKMEKSYVEALDAVESLTWTFRYAKDSFNEKIIPNDNYLKVLEYVLQALDPSIKKVEKLLEVENSYVIRTQSKDVIVQDGKIAKEGFLSSGTEAGLRIAEIITALKTGGYGFHYCDELFPFVHSDIEKMLLCVMIESLREKDQLFFTTHNADILDLALPKHSFVFLKKDVNDDIQPIKSISASGYLKRSTDSVRSAVDNDLFSVAPNLAPIYALEELDFREEDA